MKNLSKICLGIIMLFTFSFSEEKVMYQKDFENDTIFIDVNSYKILEFNKPIKDIQITNSENLVAEILENKNAPLTRLKIYAKNAGNESSIITFQDSSFISVGFNIVPHLKNLINMAEELYPNIKIEQINDTIFLKGSVKNEKDKEKILDMFTKFEIDPEKKIVNMLSTSNPKMIRIKLYAVEIDNDKGIDVKNNWTLSRNNYYQATDPDNADLKYNVPISDSVYDSVNGQRNFNLDDALKDIISNAVSLSGGLTGAANHLGKYFNTSLVLQYLSTEGVANVLDESTLITLENKEAVFKAGGEIYVRLEAQDAVELRQIDYGLELKLTANEVMNNEFIHLNITTKSRELDWANQVDNIPAITNKSINTTVIVKDKATVVLGGLVNSQNAKDIDKIPVLGNIPILGFLFKSTSFKEGKSELVFFITPEIVKAANNNQKQEFDKNKKIMFDRYEKDIDNKYIDMLNINFENGKKESDKVDYKKEGNTIKETDTKENIKTNLIKEKKDSTNKKELTPEELHQKKVNQILGYE
ncbi:hypothetical protein ACMC56_02045 [Campylobacterota bacterium DY0563]